MIRVTDLAYLHREQAIELEAAALRVLRSGVFLRGPEVEGFEREFAARCGSPAAVAVGSGVDALRLSLEALGIGPGDEVIVPSHTAIATWLAVSHAGARIVPVDPDEDSMLLDVDAVRAAIGPRTAAIVVVHLYGLVADLAPLERLARTRGLALVEDAAQAHLARDGDRVVGSIGDVGAFSLYPTKNLGAAGDGGIVVARDPALVDRIRMLGNYGERRRYHSELLGYNSRLDELQAAMLRVKLRGLDRFDAARRERAASYLRALDGHAGIVLPAPRAGTTPVWHQFVVRVDQRDALRAALLARGVETLVHYPEPPHRSAAYAAAVDVPLPVSDRLAARVLSLPVGPHVDDEAGALVCEAVYDLAGTRGSARYA
jgi:dTDP-3-amino-3,4,6-trideoxy-alpha-D-glucose transaminase